jgi:hypothetical protein
VTADMAVAVLAPARGDVVSVGTDGERPSSVQGTA